MQKKKKMCAGCESEQYIWKNYEGQKYCQRCWNLIQLKQKTIKPIANKSQKQSKLDKLYSQLRKIFLTDNPNCQAALPCCQGGATDVHHKKGRGKWYLVVKTWMAVCRPCHDWIETHPIEATEMGFRESKLTN